MAIRRFFRVRANDYTATIEMRAGEPLDDAQARGVAIIQDTYGIVDPMTSVWSEALTAHDVAIEMGADK